MTDDTRCGGSRSRIQARRECQRVIKPMTSSQRHTFCSYVSAVLLTIAVVEARAPVYSTEPLRLRA